MATSYNGWPASPDKDAIGVEPFGDAYGYPFPGGVTGGDVRTVLGYVATQLHARVEPCVSGWCWGYQYRENVNDPGSLSCHASGTAIDWNAPSHPNGGPMYGGFTDAQVGIIRQILAEVSGAVQWGADYYGTKDPMHFEIIVDAGTLAGIAAGLPSDGGPAPIPVPLPEDDGVFQLVTCADNDGMWAVAPDRFVHIPTPEHLTVGQDCGLITPDARVTNNRGMDVLADLIRQPNYEGQPSQI